MSTVKPMAECRLADLPFPLRWPLLTPGIDAEGRSLAFRAGDLCARFLLNDLLMPLYDEEAFGGCSILFHAMVYLEDRLTYELYPWPMGKIRVREEAPR
jgi:hypothetical protein